ncbi:hypothetical protein [Streptomyces humi]|uniref:hypothetical protein n=1 Tax=Streptomyces humi TaxID=1428620 RepID=UPI001160DD98|nr:hypothetical protein [Streptomyces humi]
MTMSLDGFVAPEPVSVEDELLAPGGPHAPDVESTPSNRRVPAPRRRLPRAPAAAGTGYRGG